MVKKAEAKQSPSKKKPQTIAVETVEDAMFHGSPAADQWRFLEGGGKKRKTIIMSIHVDEINYMKLKEQYGNMTRFINGVMDKIVLDLQL